ALAEAGHAAIVAPWVEANRSLLRRAVDRGEASGRANIETLAQVIPSMAAYRALVQRRPFGRDVLVEMIDGLLLPALGIVRPT
ncbi:MAG: TetR/AcrR family transcriptional regulator C-terminal ligand-binding domain-containing protein, partial [Rhodospirillales bacterium]|nr:TetR/AcrR family transcriptional regulator C-terminal ligand-binding domain-containing protein [Acetobacter sp.]